MYPGSRSDHIHNLFLPWRSLSDLDLTLYSFTQRVALAQGCCAFNLKGLAIDTPSLSFNSPFVRPNKPFPSPLYPIAESSQWPLLLLSYTSMETICFIIAGLMTQTISPSLCEYPHCCSRWNMLVTAAVISYRNEVCVCEKPSCIIG